MTAISRRLAVVAKLLESGDAVRARCHGLEG